jgi:predicted transcriptional regulator
VEEGAVIKKTRKVRYTKFEIEVMDVLWEVGGSSVREIQEHLPESRRPAYTTVQTIVYRLEEKGAVRRVRKIGNAHIFEPAVSRKTVHNRVLDELIDMFGGSMRPLMAHLVESGRLTLENLREMEDTLTRIERGEGKEPAGEKGKRRPASGK